MTAPRACLCLFAHKVRYCTIEYLHVTTYLRRHCLSLFVKGLGGYSSVISFNIEYSPAERGLPRVARAAVRGARTRTRRLGREARRAKRRDEYCTRYTVFLTALHVQRTHTHRIS